MIWSWAEREDQEFVRASYRAARRFLGRTGGRLRRRGTGRIPACGAVDPEGNAIAAWSGNERRGGRAGESSERPRSRRRGNGKSRFPSRARAGTDSPPTSSSTRAGTPRLIWQRWDGVTNLVQAAYKPAGAEWEPAVDLSEEGKMGFDSVVVLDAPGGRDAANGDATAIWVSAESRRLRRKGGSRLPATPTRCRPPAMTRTALPEVTVEAPEDDGRANRWKSRSPTEDLYSPMIEFGDGENVAGTEATHTYEAPGEYEIVAHGARGARLFGERDADDRRPQRPMGPARRSPAKSRKRKRAKSRAKSPTKERVGLPPAMRGSPRHRPRSPRHPRRRRSHRHA